MHCNFICGLSDVIIKTFSQSVSQSERHASHRYVQGVHSGGGGDTPGGS